MKTQHSENLQNAAITVLSGNREDSVSLLEAELVAESSCANTWMLYALSCDSLSEAEEAIDQALESEPENELATIGRRWFEGIRNLASQIETGEEQIETGEEAANGLSFTDLSGVYGTGIYATEETETQPAEEDTETQAEEEEAEAQRKAEEEEAEANRVAEEEAEAQRVAEEEEAEAQRKAEEEEAEANRVAEEEAEAQRVAEEEEAEAQRKAEEEAEAQRIAEEEERLEAALAQHKAEEGAEAQRITEEDAQLAAEEEEADAQLEGEEETQLQSKPTSFSDLWAFTQASEETETQQESELEEDAQLVAEEVEETEAQLSTEGEAEANRIAEEEEDRRAEEAEARRLAEAEEAELSNKDSEENKIFDTVNELVSGVKATISPDVSEATAITSEDSDEDQSEASAESNSEERPLVLAVDDSPTIRKLVTMTLTREGFEVVSAADGVDALTLLADRAPDLILSDINMPRLDGYKLCKYVKRNQGTKHIPVILLSGKDGVFDKMRGKMSGCDGYVTKPFESSELLEKVKSFTVAKI